jgi:hypothetical protein
LRIRRFEPDAAQGRARTMHVALEPRPRITHPFVVFAGALEGVGILALIRPSPT